MPKIEALDEYNNGITMSDITDDKEFSRLPLDEQIKLCAAILADDHADDHADEPPALASHEIAYHLGITRQEVYVRLLFKEIPECIRNNVNTESITNYIRKKLEGKTAHNQLLPEIQSSKIHNIMHPIDLANLCYRLFEEFTDENPGIIREDAYRKVARRLGMRKDTVQKRILFIERVDPAIQSKVARGEMTLEKAVVASRPSKNTHKNPIEIDKAIENKAAREKRHMEKFILEPGKYRIKKNHQGDFDKDLRRSIFEPLEPTDPRFQGIALNQLESSTSHIVKTGRHILLIEWGILEKIDE